MINKTTINTEGGDYKIRAKDGVYSKVTLEFMVKADSLIEAKTQAFAVLRAEGFPQAKVEKITRL